MLKKGSVGNLNSFYFALLFRVVTMTPSLPAPPVVKVLFLKKGECCFVFNIPWWRLSTGEKSKTGRGKKKKKHSDLLPKQSQYMEL